MIKRTLMALTSSSRRLLRDWRVMIILLTLYLAMLGAAYWFIATREATVTQLMLSALLAVAAPILFLVIQTIAARYRDPDARALPLVGGALRDFWKMLVIALPVIALAALAVYLFSKLGSNAPATTIRETVRTLPRAPRAVVPKSQPVHWQAVAITTLEYLVFCLILPLAAIHLWIATARHGLSQALKRAARILVRAFSPQAVVTYVIGFVFFAVIPYFLIVPTTHLGGAWFEAGLLVARLLLAVLLSLIGWVVTVGALGSLAESNRAPAVAELNEGTGHVPAEA